jgi:hypothetical protein
MMSQTQEEVTWFGERSAGPMDDDQTNKNAINSDDEERDRESEEEIHEDDLHVNYNLDNLDALKVGILRFLKKNESTPQLKIRKMPGKVLRRESRNLNIEIFCSSCQI